MTYMIDVNEDAIPKCGICGLPLDTGNWRTPYSIRCAYCNAAIHGTCSVYADDEGSAARVCKGGCK